MYVKGILQGPTKSIIIAEVVSHKFYCTS